MSIDTVLKGTSYDPTPTETLIRTLLGGALVADWRQALIARGLGWTMNVGGFSTGTDTGITGGGAGTIMDFDQPEFVISVPSGYCCIPLEFNIACRPGLQTTDSHVSDILVALDRTAAWAGDGTFTTNTPKNMRTNVAPGSCPLPCAHAFTADTTDPAAAGWQELIRETQLTDVQGTAATLNFNQLEANWTPKYPPFIIGPASIWGYWGGSIAVVGFAQLSFLAIPSALVKDLV